MSEASQPFQTADQAPEGASSVDGFYRMRGCVEHDALKYEERGVMHQMLPGELEDKER